MTPTPFETALDSGGDQVQGFATTALPIVGATAVAWLAVKYVRKIVNRFL